jgi:hypothetical protein
MVVVMVVMVVMMIVVMGVMMAVVVMMITGIRRGRSCCTWSRMTTMLTTLSI